MNEIVKTLFCDNPYLADQVCAFCDTLPAYLEAEQEYEAAARRAEAVLGLRGFQDFEEAISAYEARLTHAYYLFGLGLRREVLRALG